MPVPVGPITNLVWWLGVKTGVDDVPAGIERRAVWVPANPELGTGPIESWVYRPTRRRPVGAYFVIQGLHYEGPTDLRFDRFLRALCSAGFVIYSPILPEFTSLRVTPKAIDEVFASFEHMLATIEMPRGVVPGVFSISFGSLLALRLAAEPRFANKVGALVLFGGYADWEATIKFSITGKVGEKSVAHHDPLNQPVVFMNYVDVMDDAPDDPRGLIEAWRQFVHRTWGREEMKAGGFVAVAHEIVDTVPEDQRELFLLGCGVGQGSFALVEQAVERTPERSALLDPRPYMGGIVCPVHIMHGRDDDVIPYTQLHEMAKTLRSHGVEVSTYLTGLYGHSSSGGLLSNLPALVRELIALTTMIWAVYQGGIVTPRR